MDEIAVLGFAASLGNKIAAVSEEVEELKETLVNPMLEKGRVDTVADLANIEDPQPGWVYLVGLVSDENKSEYMYTASGTWEYLGSHVTVDAEPTQGSSNAVSSGGVYSLDIPGRLKSIAAAAAYDPSGSYSAGDYITLDGELYRCDPNGSAIVIGDNLLTTYSERLKNSTYGYIDNKVWTKDGTYANNSAFYISGTIPLTSNASYRIVTPAYTKWASNDWACCELSSYENGNSPIGNPNTVVAYSTDGTAKTFDITATKPYLLLSVFKTNESGYAVYAVSSAKFVKTTVAAELGTKADASDLTSKQSTYNADSTAWDTTPTANSTKPVTSGGIYTSNGGCVTVYLTQAEYDLLDPPDPNTEYNILEASTPSLSIQQSTSPETRGGEVEEQPEDGDMR